jgi:hypothetical protein
VLLAADHASSSAGLEGDDNSDEVAVLLPAPSPSSGAMRPSLLKRSSSQGFSRSDEDRNSREDRLSKLFVQELTSSAGKSIISAWQLRWLLTQSDGDPQAAVDAAVQYAASSPSKGPLPEPIEMQAFDVLRRLGIEESVAHTFEDAGFKTAKQLKAIESADLKSQVSDTAMRAKIQAVLTHKTEDAAQNRAYSCPDRVTVSKKFKSHFPDAPASLARAFAMAITDRTGFGLASHIMIDTYLDTMKNKPEEATESEDGAKKTEGEDGANKQSLTAKALITPQGDIHMCICVFIYICVCVLHTCLYIILVRAPIYIYVCQCYIFIS